MTDIKDFILVRHKPDETGKAMVTIERVASNPDLTDHTFLRKNENGMDEYCHKDEYEVYKKIFKVDNKDEQ